MALQPTPLPWHVDQHDGDDGGRPCKVAVIVDDRGRVIVDCHNSDVAEIHEEVDEGVWRWDAQGRANCEFIRRAVNNQEELVAACKEALHLYELGQQSASAPPYDAELAHVEATKIIQKIHEALAKK